MRNCFENLLDKQLRSNSYNLVQGLGKVRLSVPAHRCERQGQCSQREQAWLRERERVLHMAVESREESRRKVLGPGFRELCRGGRRSVCKQFKVAAADYGWSWGTVMEHCQR